MHRLGMLSGLARRASAALIRVATECHPGGHEATGSYVARILGHMATISCARSLPRIKLC
jgi:hypothetical protein